MDIQYLYEFLKLSETNNYQEAAEQLYISQSSLSKHIMSLEQEVGFALIKRTTRRIELTGFGKLFQSYALQITRLHKECLNSIRAYAADMENTLNIGAFRSMQQYDIPNLFADFSNAFPNTRLNIIESDPKQIKEELRNRRFELAFIQEPVAPVDRDTDLVKISFFDDCLAGILHKKDPLASKASLTAEDLADRNLLTYPENTISRNLLENLFASQKKLPRITFSGHRHSTIVQMAANRAGIGILLKEQALYENNSDIAAIPIEPPIIMRISLCYLKEKKLSSGALSFIEWMNSQH